MDPVHGGGPWTRDPCFVLSPYKKLICIVERVHFHVRVGVKNLTKHFFAIYCSEMLEQFSPTL